MKTRNIYESENFRVDLVEDGDFKNVEVINVNKMISIYVDRDFYTRKTKISVNWYSLGAQTVSETRRFIDVMNEAVELAERIEGTVAPRIDRGDSFEEISQISL